VTYTDEAIKASVELAARYIHDRKLARQVDRRDR